MTLRAKTRALWVLMIGFGILAILSTVVLASDVIAPGLIKDMSHDLAGMEAQQLLAYIAIVSILGMVSVVYAVGRFFLPMRLEMVRVSERLSELVHVLQKSGAKIPTEAGDRTP